MLIPDEWVGSVIGKGGNTLRALTEASGAKFWIPGESAPGSSQRAITISGPPACVAHARQLVTQRVRPLRERARRSGGGLGPMPTGGFKGTPFLGAGSGAEGGLEGHDSYDDGVGRGVGAQGRGERRDAIPEAVPPYIWGKSPGPNPYLEQWRQQGGLWVCSSVYLPEVGEGRQAHFFLLGWMLGACIHALKLHVQQHPSLRCIRM